MSKRKQEFQLRNQKNYSTILGCESKEFVLFPKLNKKQSVQHLDSQKKYSRNLKMERNK